MPQRIAIALLLTFVALPALGAEPVRFNRDVRPILADACFACHGPSKQKAGLRLDDRKIATRASKGGTIAIVPGKPEASELLHRLHSKDETEVMPPPESNKTLTAVQKETLRRWIAEGAEYEPHWSFAPIESPAIPALPTSVSPHFRNEIDSFITGRLNADDVKPNLAADRPTLIRRVAFALTGLPPTSKEVDEYLADKSPQAYEHMVDRYLASPRFGEEMARHWLDLARYGDTHGLHLDNERGTWLYRDWVVNAFNANMPFDRFTIEQLAGDLLPNPTNAQLIATGFNRCNVTTGEGGSIADEWFYRNAVDRAATVAETWLGLTAGCAVCHDHKFDPLTQKDFYSLYAFFYSIQGPSLDGNKLLHEPFLKASTPDQDSKLKEQEAKLKTVNASLEATLKTLKYEDPADAAGGATPAVKADATRSYKAWLAARLGKEFSTYPKEISTLLKSFAKKETKPTPAQEKQLRAFFLQAVCVDTKDQFTAMVKERDTLAAEKQKLEDSIPGCMIFREEAKPRDTFVMLRGQYDKPGDKVVPNTPSFLPPLKMKSRATRLDLANWLLAEENPLTARVYVNRLWQQFFGTGLVKTSADLGVQGESPSHPELLDYLASEFRDHGWDVKRTVRLLLNSAAFRRSAKATPEMIKNDPENRLYARGPRFRLDAEQVRDNALYVSGLIDLTLGGKGVKPYQPENIWEPVAFTGSNTRVYKRDDGNALYRRSLYTFIKRTAPPPFMANFDAPNREQPCSRRDRSNTPLQALQLMNDVQHIEAARGFAERMLIEGGKSAEERITFAYRTLLSRKPSDIEAVIVLGELQAHQERFARASDDAKKLIAHGEGKPNATLKVEDLAAYTLVANMLLNLDETLTRN